MTYVSKWWAFDRQVPLKGKYLKRQMYYNNCSKDLSQQSEFDVWELGILENATEWERHVSLSTVSCFKTNDKVFRTL